MSETQQTRVAVPPPDISIGVIAGEVATAAAGDGSSGPPEWIKLTPRGRVQTRDGRQFGFHPETLVARYQQDSVELPGDFDHATVIKPRLGERADAIAWAGALEARPDGVYGRVKWLPAGSQALAAQTHPYVSPAFRHTDDGEATWLHSFALVTSPALAMPALAHASNGVEAVATLTAVAGALGLTAEADSAAFVAAIQSLKDGGSVPRAIHEEVLASLAATTEQLSARQAAEHERNVAETIENALREKKITPAQRELYVSLCNTEEGFANVTALFARLVPGLQPSGLDKRRPESGPRDETPEALVARASAYREEQRRAGNTISMAVAIRTVQEKS